MRPFGAAFFAWYFSGHLLAYGLQNLCVSASVLCVSLFEPGFLMDDIKHSDMGHGQQVDTSSVLNCLQQGDAKLALQHCHVACLKIHSIFKPCYLQLSHRVALNGLTTR